MTKLEAGLKMQTQNLMHASLQAHTMQRRTASAGQSTLTMRPKASPLAPMVPSAAERVAMYKADPVNKPQTAAARDFLQSRFGITAPTKAYPPGSGLEGPQASAASETGTAGSMRKGLTSAVSPSVILPHKQRHDPYASTPAEVADMELTKGLYHLINRGLLPSKADLSPALMGANGAVRMGPAPLYPHENQFVRPQPTSALEDSMLATKCFKMDLLTPVEGPEVVQAARMAAFYKARDAEEQSRKDKEGDKAAQKDGEQGTTSGKAGDESTARPFDVLLDTFSLHEFMIRKGAVLENTPEFISYNRTYLPLWDVISLLIKQLEAICKQYAIPLAIVDGKSLADLAHGVIAAGLQPQMQDLLVCVQNIQEVAQQLRQPGRRFKGDGGQGLAATAIQSAWRGLLVRRRHSKAGRAALEIQTAWRLHRLRSTIMQRLRQARWQRDAKFQALQQGLYEQWPQMQRQSHVVVHVLSLHRTQPMALLQKDALLVAEAAQLTRLCDLAEPRVEVVLVLSSPPDDDVLNYWNKILEVGGVQKPTSRYRIVCPENHERLPGHMSTAAKLLASPKALSRVRAAVNGRMGYIVPGVVNDEEVDLATQLGLPLMGPAPCSAKPLSCKSAVRTLFCSAGCNVPPGLHVLPRAKVPPPPDPCGPNGARPLRPNTDFHITADGEVVVNESKPAPAPRTQTQFEEDEERVLLQLAEAMVRSPWAAKWLLKVDDELMGCGHAFFNTLAIKGAAEVLERTVVEERGQPSTDPSVPLTEMQKVAVYRMNELLRLQLSKKLTLAAREVYPNYQDFMNAFAVRGGVVEACPVCVVGSPQVNIFVDPLGHVALLSTHERIFTHPYRAVGNTFPQSSVPHRAILDAATSIGAACYRAGVIGHVGLDFVTLQEESSGALRLWAVDADLQPTPSLASYQLFDFLTVGEYNPANGTYCVELAPVESTHADSRPSSSASLGSASAAGLGPMDDPDPYPDLAASLQSKSPTPHAAPPSALPATPRLTDHSPASVPATQGVLLPPPQADSLASQQNYTLADSPLVRLVGAGPQASAAQQLEAITLQQQQQELPQDWGQQQQPHLLQQQQQQPNEELLPEVSASSQRWGPEGDLAYQGQQHQQHQQAGHHQQQPHHPQGGAELQGQLQGGAQLQGQLQEGLGSNKGGDMAYKPDGWSLASESSVAGSSEILSSRPQGSVEGSLQQSPLGPGSQLGHRDEPPLPQAGAQRFYFSLDSVSSSVIASTPCARFFHSCWQEGLHFDVDGRVGVVFNISERYMLGTLSMLTVGMAPHEMYATMLRVLSFISNKEREMEQSSTMVQRRAALGLESLTSFRDLQVLVKYMAEKSAAVVRNHQSVRVPSIASSSTLL